jgi:hypothetical protein
MNLSQGQSISLVVNNGQSIYLRTDVQVDYTLVPFGIADDAVEGVKYSTDGVVQLGPFYVQTTVILEAVRGDCVFSRDPLPQLDVAVSVKDSHEFSGNVTGSRHPVSGNPSLELGGVALPYLPPPAASITGDYVVGEELTVNLSLGWSATGYQWTADGDDIADAESATYTLTETEEGAEIGCKLSGLVYSIAGLVAEAAPEEEGE